MNIVKRSVDFLVVGGGTAGCMAAIKAKHKNPDAHVLVLEKANIRRSGAIAMGMDGVVKMEKDRTIDVRKREVYG